MVSLSGSLGLDALADPAYRAAEARNFYGAVFGNLSFMLIMIALSVWKPKIPMPKFLSGKK